MTKGSIRDERGSTVVEFAMAAAVFFVMIFGIIEFGRLLYTHNALTDAARRGARYAVLHAEDHKCVKNVVVYGESHVDPDTDDCDPTGPPLINGLTEDNVVVTYEGADLDGNPDSPNPWGTNLGTATVSIEGYVFDLSIPFVGRTLNMPAYSTTLTSESAGTEPDPL
ncbi:MAG TPA: TadE family protein [Pyrinomonadaceae bacterium]|nr:TadE family protein [Pyrinomonadaceae bacterium]